MGSERGPLKKLEYDGELPILRTLIMKLLDAFGMDTVVK